MSAERPSSPLVIRDIAAMPETRRNRADMIQTGKHVLMRQMKGVTPEEFQILDLIN